MKKVFNSKIVSAVVVGVLLVSGCAKKETAEKPTYDAVVPAPVAQEPAPAELSPSDAKTRMAYYEANLEKAKARWVECKKAGPEGMTPAEKKDCSMAQSAWEFQPFKARK